MSLGSYSVVLVRINILFCILTGTGFGISQSSRLSSSVSAMRVLNTGSDVEEAVADALVSILTSPPLLFFCK